MVGSLALRRPTLFPSELAFDPTSNTLFLSARDRLYVVDQNTGATTLLGRYKKLVGGTYHMVMGIVFDVAQNRLLGIDAQPPRSPLWLINPSTGEATVLMELTDLGGYVVGLAFARRP